MWLVNIFFRIYQSEQLLKTIYQKWLLMKTAMAVKQNFNKRGANNRIFDVVENNNKNKSKLLWTDNFRELFALKCNGNNRKYNIWITSAIFIILLVPVFGNISSRINNGMLNYQLAIILSINITNTWSIQ